ncbi:MAG: tryptophan synthase subunit alpha [Chitinophagaceae bacterium]|nr:tryptophan synthase subunit alpha [Chitinophagaceae bacterium]
MNRVQQLFQQKEKNILSIYFTAGYPKLESTVTLIEYLDQANVDMIEIGMPFSDPLADGPTIQQANSIALENGMSLKKLLEQLKDIRTKTQIPILLMGYLNPILQYGEGEFLRDIHNIGIDGLIIPDMPLSYYKNHLQELYQQYHLAHVMLVTPTTTEERIKEIDQNSSGFIYLVSSNSITGNQLQTNHQKQYFEKIQRLQLNNKTILGFGIHNKETVTHAFEHCNGAIVGSAFVRFLATTSITANNIQQFINNLRP